MAAGKWIIHGQAGLEIINGTIDLDDDTYRMVLLESTYTPDTEHDEWSDLSTHETADTGYTADGVLTAFTVSRSGQVITIDLTDEQWTEATFAGVQFAAIIRDADANGALAATDRVVAHCNLDVGGSGLASTNGTVSIAINASGAATVTFGSTN